MVKTIKIMKKVNSLTLLSMNEKAKEKGVSYRTMLRWVKNNKIPFITLKKSKRRWFLKKEEEDLTKKYQKQYGQL